MASALLLCSVAALVLTLAALTSRTLLVGKTGLEQAKQAIRAYKEGKISTMTPELWRAKKIVDSTVHPGSSLR